MRERRLQVRQEQRWLVRFASGEEMRSAFTWDVSEDGLFLRTVRPPAPGTDLRLLLRGPGGQRERRGTVVWARLNLQAPEDPRLGSGAGIRLHPESGASARNE